jgi:C4-dicarboxylate-specific signal transduction histidine kinase
MSVARNTAAKGIGRELPVEGAAEVQRFANAGRLAASVSQDLLSALGVAQTDVGFLCDLLEQRERQRDMRETVEDARAAISRAVSRISAVLSVARPRRGEVVALDVREVIGAALFDLEARLSAFSVALDMDKVPLALAERGGLLQSLASLLLDAADNSPQRGRIVVGLRYAEGQIAIAIDDEGPAPLSAETLPDHEGTPLWLCRNVVRSFGGELSVSQGVLGGRRVVVRLRPDRP